MRIGVEYLIGRYKDHLFGAAFSVTQNGADAQDAVQDTFIRYYQSDMEFDNEEHIRLWLFRTVYNRAKDIRKAFWKRSKVDLDEVVNFYFPQPSDQRDLFAAVRKRLSRARAALKQKLQEEWNEDE